MLRSSKTIAIVVVLILAGAFLGWTAPGQPLLAHLGLATACDYGCN